MKNWCLLAILAAALPLSGRCAVYAQGASTATVVANGVWGPEDDSPNNGNSSAVVSFVPGRKSGQKAVQLDYSLGDRYQYRYAMAVINYPSPQDWTPFKGIRFWAKGTGGKLEIDICSRTVGDYDYHAFIIQEMPAQWKEYKIPFSAFKQGGWGKQAALDLTRVFKLQFKAASMKADEEGSFTIDGLSFLKENLFKDKVSGDTFMFADFEDMLYDALGDQWKTEDDSWNHGNSVCQLKLGEGQGSGESSMRFEYKLGQGYQYRYAITKVEFAKPLDLSAYKTIKFWVRGSGNKLRLHVCSENVKDYDYHEYYIPATPKEWRQYKVPFEIFKQEGWGKNQALDLAKVVKLQFQTGSMVAGEDGWFEVDNISFIKNYETTEVQCKVFPVIDSDKKPGGCYLGVFGPGYAEDFTKVRKLEANIGKKFAQVMWYVDWTGAFPADKCEALSKAGYMPNITWEAWNAGTKIGPSLDDILAGKWDIYIKKWAADSKAFGKPYMLRWGHEFNGDWYPWSVPKNGMDAGKYVKAYRYIHDAFAAEGVKNVIWLWSPMNESQPRDPRNDVLKAYPGDKYVDWIAVDAYNFGNQAGFNYGWKSFDELMSGIYTNLVDNIPNKPIMIGEFASGNIGGEKAAWIKEMGASLKKKFPAIKLIIWFNINKETDWCLNNEPAYAEAFHDVVRDDYFLTSPAGLVNVPGEIGAERAKYMEALKELNPWWEKKPLSIPRLANVPKIDGSLEGWTDGAAVISIGKSSADLSAKIYLAYDDKALYIGCDVKDNAPLVNTSRDGDSWQGDCVELALGTNPDDNVKRVDFSKDDYQLLLNPGNGSSNDPDMWNAALRKKAQGEIAARRTNRGYTLSAAIPFSNFGGFAPKAGARYGFDLAVDDADGKEGRKSQSVWFGTGDFYKNPSVWNQVEFK